MTSRPSVQVSYRKLKGTLSVKPTQIEWIPLPGQSSAAPVAIPVGLIRRLQATPVSNPKVMIKVFVSQNPAQEPVPNVFTFTSANAREDCDAIQEAIKIATAERNRPKTVADILREGEEGLLRNTDVQMSLLKQDVELSKMFRALVIDGQLTDEQFWRARIHLLRAHAIEQTQQRGPYNVLAVLKPKTQDGTTKVSLSADRIRDIFEQHPLVKKAYDENVPKLSEDDFWARFFVSRLKKKLSGEKITDKDLVDDVMDKYLRPDYDQINKKRSREEEVPNFVNLEGNEEHVSKKSGNQPDRTMRPGEDVPIMHAINSLSRRMVDSVTQEPEFARGTDVEYFAQLRLADLEPQRPDDHRSLAITNPEGLDFSPAAATGTKKPTVDLVEALRKVQGTMRQDDVDLLSIGKASSSLSLAARHITSDIKAQAKALSAEGTNNQLDMPDSVLSQVYLTHSASTEFLRQFWLTYLSPAKSPAKKKELETLVQSLKRTLERMDAVQTYAVKEGGDLMGKRVSEVLASAKRSVKKAIGLLGKSN